MVIMIKEMVDFLQLMKSENYGVARNWSGKKAGDPFNSSWWL